MKNGSVTPPSRSGSPVNNEPVGSGADSVPLPITPGPSPKRMRTGFLPRTPSRVSNVPNLGAMPSGPSMLAGSSSQINQASSTALITPPVLPKINVPVPEYPAECYDSPPSMSQKIADASASQGICNTPARQFLSNRLKKQALSDLLPHLQVHFGDNWGFTGSVALNVHAAKYNYPINRPFQDADILICSANYRNLDFIGENPDFLLPKTADNEDKTHHKFKDLLVDLIDSKVLSAANFQNSIERINEVPVLPLEKLIEDKKSKIDSVHSDEDQLKAKRDLIILNTLLDLKKQEQS